jgi:hypothetical protein
MRFFEKENKKFFVNGISKKTGRMGPPVFGSLLGVF